MNIPKAIEILTIHNDHNPNYTDKDRNEAHQLGIEALKWVRKWREIDWTHKPVYLPGETPEPTPKRSLHHIKAVLESPLGIEPDPTKPTHNNV